MNTSIYEQMKAKNPATLTKLVKVAHKGHYPWALPSVDKAACPPKKEGK